MCFVHRSVAGPCWGLIWDCLHSAVQYWITSALENSTRVVISNDMESADLVYIDMHCYHMWWWATLHPYNARKKNKPDTAGFVLQSLQVRSHACAIHTYDWV